MSDLTANHPAKHPIIIINDLYCIYCGYNLRTLQTAGRCPECGRAVANSLLKDRYGEWLQHIHRGFGWLLKAIVVGTLLMSLVFCQRVTIMDFDEDIIAFCFDSPPLAAIGWRSVFNVEFLLACMVCLGIYKVSCPSPYSRTGQEATITAGIALFSSVLAIFLTITRVFTSRFGDITRNLIVEEMLILIVAVGGVCLIHYAARLMVEWNTDMPRRACVLIVLLILTCQVAGGYLGLRTFASLVSDNRKLLLDTIPLDRLLAVLRAAYLAMVFFGVVLMLQAAVFFALCQRYLSRALINKKSPVGNILPNQIYV